MAATAHEPLEVAIIGAGIAGLSACIALRKAGHNVELFEKSRFRSEIGAAMSITPNGNKVLEHWGFDYKAAGETVKIQNRLFTHDTLEVLEQNDYKYIPELYGRFNAFHRVDLHSELRRLAEDKDLPGTAEFRLGVDVQEIDCDAATLTLKDGEKVQKDFIVVADGIKSRFVKDINGVDVPRVFTGMSTHRTLIDIDVLLQNPVTRPIYEGQDSGFVHTIDPESGIMIFTYPCRDDKVMNYAIFHRAKESEKGGDDWNAPADIDDVLSLIGGFHPFWVELTKASHPDNFRCFPVSRRDPLEKNVRAKAVIIGDAAHACLPTHGQGGSMAIEDAAALGVLFEGAKKDEIEERLKLWEQLRLPRSATTQLMSNAMMYYKPGDEVKDRVLAYYPYEIPMGRQLFTKAICEFFFPYDIFEQSKVAAKYLHQPGGVPAESMTFFGKAQQAVAA